MRAFVVRAAERGWPILGVFDALLDGRATIGWSRFDNQNLRVIDKTLSEGGTLDENQQEARLCLGFLRNPSFGHYLLYPHQPEGRQFFVVKVDGDYDYGPAGKDFRSFRPCVAVTPKPVSMYDAMVPAKLRYDLGRQGRFYEIHDTAAFASFLYDIAHTGQTDYSNRPALSRIHRNLRKHIPEALATEFSRHDLSRKFCSQLFERMGHSVDVQEGRYEKGSDIVVTLGDSLLPDDVQFRIGVQVFAYVGEVAKLDLVGKLEQLLKGWVANDLRFGVLLTTGRCSAEARDAVIEHNRANGDRLIRLIDASDLADLFLRYFPPEER